MDLMTFFRDSSLNVKVGLLTFMTAWSDFYEDVTSKTDTVKMYNLPFGFEHEEFVIMNDIHHNKVRN